MGEAAATFPAFARPAPGRSAEWLGFARRNPTLVVGLLIVAAIVLFGLIGPFLIHQEATRTTAFAKDLSPTRDHLLGTDSFGRDIFALIVVGTPQTIKVGLIAGVIGLLARAGICVWQTYLVVTRRPSRTYGRLHLMK